MNLTQNFKEICQKIITAYILGELVFTFLFLGTFLSEVSSKNIYSFLGWGKQSLQ